MIQLVSCLRSKKKITTGYSVLLQTNRWWLLSWKKCFRIPLLLGRQKRRIDYNCLLSKVLHLTLSELLIIKKHYKHFGFWGETCVLGIALF